MKTPRLLLRQRRYHWLLVVLHWVLAVAIIAMLMVGLWVLDAMPTTSPNRPVVLGMHMAVGVLILVLTVVRLGVRLRTKRPLLARTGHAALDRLAPLVHGALYWLVIGTASSGVALAIAAGLPQAAFDGSALPAAFDVFPARRAHGAFAATLAICIALHVAAALYHQFVLRDGLLSRMGVGRDTDGR